MATVVELCQGKYTMAHPQFWGGIIFHGVMGFLGMFLLTKAIPFKPKGETAGSSDSLESRLEQMFESGKKEENIIKSIGEADKKENHQKDGD